ncbi:E3 ubiquitin-protein ligase HERC2 [Hondaea fermentalgiana]|uniref:E3 ubiquitin-protein ligase HERC2 n=1 Tax=Hondaea fermentalgiana TaxID=2315210 RepID=A0A2R5GCW6_9STRA|nr:E3 ubiquitin-protein ligase HERC2 [Hondaea fermentalgiana]|eukprot:GBG27548.1 E3 ubiquitin-protein ligase HERC2 [Hondaea fermentalgiana]
MATPLPRFANLEGNLGAALEFALEKLLAEFKAANETASSKQKKRQLRTTYGQAQDGNREAACDPELESVAADSTVDASSDSESEGSSSDSEGSEYTDRDSPRSGMAQDREDRAPDAQEKAPWAADLDEGLESDEVAQVHRLTRDLTNLGRRSPVTRAFTYDLVKDLARGDPAAVALHEDAAAQDIKTDQHEDENEVRTERRSSVPRPGQDVDVFALLSDDDAEIERTVDELAHREYGGPTFATPVLESYKSKFAELYTQSMRGRKRPADGQERQVKLSRSILGVVLAQLLLEGDVVLHKTLLHSPLFPDSGSLGSGKRRKKSRRRSNSFLHALNPDGVARAYEEVASLVEKATETQSLVGFLIAAKFLLTLHQYVQEDSNEVSAAILKATRVNKEVEVLAARSAPCPNQALASLRRELNLGAAARLGATLPPHVRAMLLLEDLQSPVSNDGYASPPNAASLPTVAASVLTQTMQFGDDTDTFPNDAGAPKVSQEQEDDDDNDANADDDDNENGEEGQREKSSKRSGRRISRSQRRSRAGSSATLTTIETSSKSTAAQSTSPGVALSLLSGRSVHLDQRGLVACIPRYTLLEKNQDESVEHHDVRCDGCDSNGPILGQRFECASCESFDLCLDCYLAEKHTVEHAFRLSTEHRGPATLLPPRTAPKLSYVGTPCATLPLGAPDLDDASVIAWEVIVDAETQSCKVGWIDVECDFELPGHQDQGLGAERGSWGVDLQSGVVTHAGKTVGKLEIPIALHHLSANSDTLEIQEDGARDNASEDQDSASEEDEEDEEGNSVQDDAGKSKSVQITETSSVEGFPSERPCWSILCWVHPVSRKAGFAVAGSVVSFDLHSASAVIPCVSFRNDFQLESLGHIEFKATNDKIHTSWLLDSKNSQSTSQVPGRSIRSLASCAHASCVRIPRGDEKSCVALLESPGFRNASKVGEDFTFEAMVCWEPEAFGTPDSASQIYTLFSRTDASSQRSRSACTQIGIVGDGYLFVNLQTSEFCTWSHRAIMIPGKWQHVRIAVIGGSYRGPSVRFSVDNAIVHSDTRKRKSSGGSSALASWRQREQNRHRDSASRRHTVSRGTKSDEKQGLWILGGAPSLEPSHSNEESSTDNTHDIEAHKVGVDGNPKDAGDGASALDEDGSSVASAGDDEVAGRSGEDCAGNDAEAYARLAVTQQFQGCFAEVRLWTRSLRSREYLDKGGRVLKLVEASERSSLFFRLRLDESAGKRVFRSGDENFEVSSHFMLCGSASCEPRVIADLVKDAADSQDENAVASEATNGPSTKPDYHMHAAVLLRAEHLRRAPAAQSASVTETTAASLDHIASVFMDITGNLLRITSEFAQFHKDLKQSITGIKSPVCSVFPHVHTFLLLQSLVIRYLQSVAPPHWLQERKMDRNEMGVAKDFPSDQIAEAYNDLDAAVFEGKIIINPARDNILMTLNTNAMTLEICDADRPVDLTEPSASRSLGIFTLPDIFQTSNDGLVYPALCTYEEGDRASFIAFAEGNAAQGHWTLDERLLRDRADFFQGRELCVEDCIEAILHHAARNAERIGHDQLRSMLSFPLAWILLWPAPSVAWVEKVRVHLQATLHFLLQNAKGKEISNTQMLACAAYGKLCSFLITSKPSDLMSSFLDARDKPILDASNDGMREVGQGGLADVPPARTGSSSANATNVTSEEDAMDVQGHDASSPSEQLLQLSKWKNSSLFSHGLRLPGCLLADLSGRTRRSAAAAASQGHTSKKKGDGPASEVEIMDTHAKKRDTLPAGVLEIINDHGIGRSLHAWLLGHLNLQSRRSREPNNSSSSKHDSEISRVTNGLVVVLLHHTGWLPTAMEMAQLLADYPNQEYIARARPHPELVAIWRSALELRAWLERQRQQSTAYGANSRSGGTNDSFLATINQAVYFLLDFAPASGITDDENAGEPANALAAFRESLGISSPPATSLSGTLERAVSEGRVPAPQASNAVSNGGLHSIESSPPSALSPTSSLPLRGKKIQSRYLARSRSLGAASASKTWNLGQLLRQGSAARGESSFKEVISQVSAFVHDAGSSKALSVDQLHGHFLALRACARTRERGFRSLAASLLGTPLSVSTQALHAAMLIGVPSALRGRDCSSSAETRSAPWHYLQDLGPSGSAAQLSLASGFAALGRALAELLQASMVLPTQRLTGLQLELLDALGVRLAPIDHELLARTNLLETLHRIMESSREAMAAAADAFHPAALAEGELLADTSDAARTETNESVAAHQLVGRAAMKTFYLLCSQVAAFRPPAAAKSRRNARSSLLLTRVRSGPQTLNVSVFGLLLQELTNAADALDDTAATAAAPLERYAAPSTGANFIASSFTLVESPQSDAKLHMEEITSVLLSTCTFPSCQRQISSSEWLEILCRLAQRGPVSVLQNIFRIFRRMLPLLDPHRIDLPMGSTGRERDPLTLESFLLELVATSFTPRFEEITEESQLLASFEAMRTLRALQSTNAWRSRIHALLLRSIKNGIVSLSTGGSTAKGEVPPRVGASSSSDLGTNHGGGETAQTSDISGAGAGADAGADAGALARCLGALSVTSGALRKLLPGVAVRTLDKRQGATESRAHDDSLCDAVAWTERESRELGELDAIDILRVVEQDSLVISGFSADTSDRRALERRHVSVNAEQVFVAKDRNDVRVDAGSPLPGAIHELFEKVVMLEPWTSTNWQRSFGFSQHARGRIQLFDAPSGAGAVEQTLSRDADDEQPIVWAKQRLGQWIEVEKVDERSSGDVAQALQTDKVPPRWVKVQDAENDYILRPVLAPPAETTSGFQRSLLRLYTLQTLSAVDLEPVMDAKDCGLKEANTLRDFFLLSEKSMKALLSSASEEVATFRASDLDVLSERLTIIIDELVRGRKRSSSTDHASDVVPSAQSEDAEKDEVSAKKMQSLDKADNENSAGRSEGVPGVEARSSFTPASGVHQRRTSTQAPSSITSSSARQRSRMPRVPAESILALMDMGFPRRWAQYALEQNELDVTAAITYICALEEEIDERIALSLSKAEDAQSSSESEEDEDEENDDTREHVANANKGSRENDQGNDADDKSGKSVQAPASKGQNSASDPKDQNSTSGVAKRACAEDYMEMEGSDGGGSSAIPGAVPSRISYSDRNNRSLEPESTSGRSRGKSGGGQSGSSRARNEWTKSTSEVQRACRRHWGPCADSRASYRHLLESYSPAELFEEFRHLVQVINTLQARVVLLRCLIVDGARVSTSLTEEDKAKLVRLLVAEGFQTFPLYGVDCLESITRGSGATLWNIPQSLHSFAAKCIETSEAFVAELILSVKKTLRRAATTDFFADTPTPRDDLAMAAESSDSLLWFVDWVTRQLMHAAPLGNELHFVLFESWVWALRSPSMRIKASALGILAEFLDDAADIGNSAERSRVISRMLTILPRERLVAMAARLLRRVDNPTPGPSGFCKVLLQFIAKVEEHASLANENIFEASPSFLTLGRTGYVELRNLNGHKLETLQPPWTLTVWVQAKKNASDVASLPAEGASDEPQVLIGDSSSGRGLQIVMSAKGLGVRLGGSSTDVSTSTFGFSPMSGKENEHRADGGEWTQLTIVCADYSHLGPLVQMHVPVNGKTETRDGLTSKNGHRADGNHQGSVERKELSKNKGDHDNNDEDDEEEDDDEEDDDDDDEDDDGGAESNWALSDDRDEVDSYLSDGVFQMNSMGVDAYIQFHKITQREQKQEHGSRGKALRSRRDKEATRGKNVQSVNSVAASRQREKQKVHLLAYENGSLRGTLTADRKQAFLGLREIGSASHPSAAVSVGRLCVWRSAMDRAQVRQAESYLRGLSKCSLNCVLCPPCESALDDPLLDAEDMYTCWDFTWHNFAQSSASNNSKDNEGQSSIVTEARHHRHVAVLHEGAAILPCSTPCTGESNSECAAAEGVKPAILSSGMEEEAKEKGELMSRVEPRFRYLVDGIDMSGVILWDLSDSPVPHALAVPSDFQRAHLPVRLHLQLKTSTELVGHLKCKERDKDVWCAVEGTLETKTKSLTIRVCSVVRGNKFSHHWLTGLCLDVKEDCGELQGTWKSPQSVPHWGVLAEDSPKLRAVACLSPAYLDLGVDGTFLRVRCDVLEYQKTLPPFVLDQRPMVATCNTVVLEAGRWQHKFPSPDHGDDDGDGAVGGEHDGSGGSGAGPLAPATWSCPACTFLNEMEHSCCAICTTPNPDNASEEQDNDESALFGLEVEGLWKPGSGSYIWEFRVHGSAAALNQGEITFGICRKGAPLRDHLGACANSWGVSSDGLSWYKGRNRALLPGSLQDNDILALELDTNDKLMRIFVNGEELAKCDRSNMRSAGDFLLESSVSPAISISSRTSVSAQILGLKHGSASVRYAYKANSRGGDSASSQRRSSSRTSPVKGKIAESIGRTSRGGEDMEPVQFEGNWRQGRRYGKGLTTFSDGSTEEGSWLDGLKHGRFKTMSSKESGASEIISQVYFQHGEVKTDDSMPSDEALNQPSEIGTGSESALPSGENLGAEQSDGKADLGVVPNEVFRMQGTFAASCHQLVRLDPTTAGPGIRVSPDCMTAEYTGTGPDTGKRSHVLGARGYTRGVHYWEARMLGMQWGSTLIGVTDRKIMHELRPRQQSRSVSQSDIRGDGWGDGFGFVNYRATHSPDGEQLYGSFYAVNDVVGVLLDMDRGRLHFFKDFQDYQNGDKQVIIDLGLAYSDLRRKCRSGRRRRTGAEDIKFYPCFGFSKAHDRITLQDTRSLEMKKASFPAQVFAYAESVNLFRRVISPRPANAMDPRLLAGLTSTWEGISSTNGAHRTVWSLGRIPVKLWTSPDVCEAASPPELSGLRVGDRLTTKRGPATILGARGGALWYTVDGADEALFWSPKELQKLVRDGKVRRETADERSISSAGTAHEVHDRARDQDSRRSKEKTRKPDGVDGGKDNVSSPYEQDGPYPGVASVLHDALSCSGGMADWSEALDQELVVLVNRLCDRRACEPEHLSPHDVASELKHCKTARAEMRRLLDFEESFVLARFTALLHLNSRMRSLFELVDLHTSEASPGQVVFRATPRSGSVLRSAENRARGYSTAKLLSRGRGHIFSRVKLEFWNAAIAWTTTPTVPASDEYDPPPDFPVVRVNRITAGDQRLTALEGAERLQTSVFGQLMVKAGMETWPSRMLRRSYSHIQDASQQRCFFVKFESEGVDDHGGPYRAVFQIAIEDEAAGPLQILLPCPNAADGALENADRMVFSELRPSLDAGASHGRGVETASASIPTPTSGRPSRRRTSDVISQEQSWPEGAAGSGRCLEFLGRLIGVATRHGIHVGLSLAHLIWRPLVGLPVGWRELHETDSFTARSLRQIESLSDEQWADEDAAWSELLLDRLGAASSSLPAGCVVHRPGQAPYIPYESRSTVVEAIVRQCIMTAAEPVTRFMEGLAEVLPTEHFVLFTPEELERLICGAPEIDVGLLKQATVYEDVDPNAPHVKYFWEALEDMTQEERSKFVNFVCARSRLPPSLDKFPMSFKILPLARKPGASTDNNADDDDGVQQDDILLPQSQTCFFTLALPEYSSKEVCSQKLLYAANNCNTMEDFDEHDAQAFSGLI